MITRSLKLQLLLFEWLQWNLTWIKSDRSCQNKFSRSIFWYLCCVPANNLSGTHPSPRLSVGLNCSISHKTSSLRLRHTLPHCVHCWKLIQSSILYFLCRSPCSSASQTTHCATIQFLTQSRAQSLLRHLSTLDRVNFLLLYFIYRALFLTKIYANE